MSLALLARYQGRTQLAREQADLAVLLAQAAAAAPVHAFALYTVGEVAVDDDDHGVGPLTEAAQMADRIGARQVSQLARVALLAALVRTGDAGAAAELAGPVLQELRGAAAWPQVWTTQRILAELLASCGRHHHAALLLAAAEADPAAPPVTGEDVERYESLWRHLRRSLGDDVADRIRRLGAAVSREQALDRTLAAVDALARAP